MGTTLTGTTPQDTYDSLIKVTDNGPLSGTAKYLSDGLGNDSALALSTTSVGIGTATPDQKLNIVGSQTTAYATSSGSEVVPLGGVNMTMQNTGTGGFTSMRFVSLNGSNAIGYLGFTNTTSSIGGSFVFGQRSGGGYAEQVRIDASGNVGIGTSLPAQKLDVAGRVKAAGDDYHSFAVASGTAQVRLERTGAAAGVNYIGSDSDGLHMMDSAFAKKATFTANGLTFNGDTAAANALDDYEEGTWTMGLAFGGASVGVTYGVRTGTYTKVGRKVTVNGLMSLSNKGTSTGAATITGLPFTIASGNPQYATAAICLFTVSYTGQFYAFGNVGSTSIVLEEVSSLGAPTNITDTQFANNSSMVVSLTYFV